ncbi:MAG: DUF2057 domain-containing protein, partial [Perlucidibaca sp.]
RALPVAAISLLVTLASGCSTLIRGNEVALYSGPELSQAQVATVIAPEEVQLLALDGKELPVSLFGTRETRFALLPGEHVFSLRYAGFFQINSENHDVVRSRPLALRFVARAGETYRFDYASPRDVDSAREFAKNAELTLVGDKGGQRIKTQAIRSFAEASLIDTIGKAFQSDDTQAAVRASQLAAPAVSAQALPAAPLVAPTSQVHYDLLRELWLRASPDERALFQQWMLTPGAQGK